jgi:tetratricopeptide (TPR) repeat protein
VNDPDQAFREAKRALALSQGFTLFPVEIAGPDVARELAAWLAAQGWSPSVIEPLDDDAWKNMVADLFAVTPADDRVVLLIGTREPAPGVYQGLHLLNQRRDSVARHLACPLLWCGPPEFIKLTWERAPDFWSIRALPLRLDVSPLRASEPPLWPAAWVADPPERLRFMLHSALKQKDDRNAARIAASLAEALVARSELDEAEETLAKAAGPEASLTLGTIAALRGDRARAEALFAQPVGPELEGRRLIGLGNLHLQDDRPRAVASFQQASELLAQSGDRANHAVALADLGVAALADGDFEEAEARLSTAVHVFREIGDERNEARALSKLGSVHLAQRDSRAACDHFEAALAIFRNLGDAHGEGEVLRRLARAYLELGDPEKARDDSERAISIAKDLGDEAGAGEAEALSERARKELTKD